jgi:ABC-type glycerol-3-phosphate transport system permease component
MPKTMNRLSPLKVLIIVLIACFAILWIMPFLWMVSTAFKPTEDIYKVPLRWLPSYFTIEHFFNSFKRAPFNIYYRNSIVISLVSSTLILFTSSMAGFSIARLKFQGRHIILGGILSSTMIPFQVLLIPFFVLMTKIRLVNTFGGLIVPYLTIFLAFALFMFYGFFKDFPAAMEDSARIDGCSWYQVYFRIGLPLAKPAIATVVIYSFIDCWNEFMVALIMTSKDIMRTVPLGLAAMRNTNMGINWGELMAASLIACLPAVVFFLIMQRQFIAGLTKGAVKG